MLCIRLLSGEDVARLPVEEMGNVRDVKRRLHQLHGLPPRFRQRLLFQGADLDDADELESPRDLDLVLQTFWDASQTQAHDLVAAARDGSADTVESMLQMPLDPDLSTDRERPLTAASGQGHVEVVRLLLEAGADKNLADNDGSTALMCAALWEKVEVMRLLLEAGADMNMADIDGNTALMHAAGEGNHGALRLLVEAGADKNLKNKNGETASFLAARASC